MTISINFLAFWDAPPIKKPSILLISLKFLIFLGFTEPPYKTFGDLSLNLLLIKLTVSKRSFGFGTIPVPMAQTGSYAINLIYLFFIPSKQIKVGLDGIKNKYIRFIFYSI